MRKLEAREDYAEYIGEFTEVVVQLMLKMIDYKSTGPEQLASVAGLIVCLNDQVSILHELAMLGKLITPEDISASGLRDRPLYRMVEAAMLETRAMLMRNQPAPEPIEWPDEISESEQ